MMQLLRRRAPKTWRDFFLLVAAIAVAALVVLVAIDLFHYFHDARDPGPLAPQLTAPHTDSRSQPLPDTLRGPPMLCVHPNPEQLRAGYRADSSALA
jgi:hypothetical protein